MSKHHATSCHTNRLRAAALPQLNKTFFADHPEAALAILCTSVGLRRKELLAMKRNC